VFTASQTPLKSGLRPQSSVVLRLKFRVAILASSLDHAKREDGYENNRAAYSFFQVAHSLSSLLIGSALAPALRN